jgi:hypothetical protein
MRDFMNPNKGISVEYRPIVIPKATMDMILQQGKNSLQLLGLYSYYYYVSVWQKTETPACTLDFTSDGLNIDIKTVKKYKKMLKNLGLIRNVVLRDSAGEICGHKIKVCFFEKPHFLQNNPTTQKTDFLMQNPKGSSPPMYRGMLPPITKPLKMNNNTTPLTFSMECAKKLYSILAKNNKIMRIPKYDKWADEFKQLRRDGIPKEKIVAVLQWYERHIRDTFTPKAYSAKSFHDKFINILDQMERESQNKAAQVHAEKESCGDAGTENFPDWESNQDCGMTLAEWKELSPHMRKQIERPKA